MDPQRALLEAARSLMRAGDSREIIYEILIRARDVMQCEVCSVLLPDEETGELVIRSTLNDKGPDGPLRVPAGQGISGEVFRTREPINSADAQADPRHYALLPQRVGLVTRAMLTIPLMDGDECLGVMQAINPRQRPSFGGEEEEIFLTFGSLVSATLVRMKAHESALREAANRRELTLAHEIQASFLPAEGAAPEPFVVRAFYQPANLIGGDFYFWHPLDDGRLLAGLGDVSGKGLVAALDMARCSTLIPSRAADLKTQSLGQWVARFNDVLCQLLRPGRFIAVSFMLLDPARQKLSVVSAGQFPPRAYLGNRWVPLTGHTSPPLGITAGLKFREKVWPLGLAREWLLFSDGLLEAQNALGEYFDEAQFEKILGMDSAPLPRLVDAWRRFAPASKARDDCTILWLRDTRPAPPLEHEGTCCPESIPLTRQFFETWAAFAGYSEKNIGLIVLAADEVLTNIYRHAYGECAGRIRVQARLEPESLSFHIVHFGEGLDSSEVPEPEPACPQKCGGMGMGVVQKVFDEVDFARGSKLSRVQLRKALRRRPDAPLDAPPSGDHPVP